CPSCFGDACREFAPRQDIMPALGVGLALRRPLASVPALPLVSCILPTRDRPAFVMEALRGFLNQDYPHRELIVVDDGDTPIGNLMPADERIRYFRMASRQSLGAKRNFACEQARGEFIAHIDDDDVYPSHRLSTQARALIAQGAAICGTSSLYFFEPITDRGWLYTYPRRGWIAGATLLYRRSYWSRRPFAPLQVGEDWRFLEGLRGPDELVDLADPRLCVATIHRRNTSPKQIEAPLWVDLPSNSMTLDLDGRARRALRAAAGGSPPVLPLVSCIMPTSDRVEFVDLAIRKFEAQDYPHKELIVLDAGGSAAAGIRKDLPSVRYIPLDASRRVTIGEMRNRACSFARGEVICIWDDDDWYAPERLRYQVLPILYGEADLTGLRCGHLLCLPSAEVWTVDDTVHRRMFESDVAGGTIAFLRRVWAEVRFPHIDLAEDAALIRIARARGYRLKQIEKRDLFAYVRHSRNTWQFEPGKFYDARAWSRTDLPPGFGREMVADHLEAYRAWVRRKDDSA
ncbi:MAG TPA: glycosyltransferase family 2 protein, partial [Polyangiaceae bacterium]